MARKSLVGEVADELLDRIIQLPGRGFDIKKRLLLRHWEGRGSRVEDRGPDDWELYTL